MGKRKFIVDCDVGTDDAQAILMLLSKYQQDVEVLAITAVFGNAPLENTAHNALRVLKVRDRLDIPVYKGCDRPHTGGQPFNFKGRGDGMGDVKGEYQADTSLLQKEPASEAIVRLVTENAGEVILVALGPLTNIAAAIRLDRQFGPKLKDFVMMGGNIIGPDSSSSNAGFNIKCDPESAAFVLDNLGKVCTVVPQNICKEYSFEWEWYEHFVSHPTERAKFVQAIDRAHVLHMKKKNAKKYSAWDQLGMAVALDDKVAMETAKHYLTVELQEGLARGQMIVDWTGETKKSSNAMVVKKVDLELYKRYMIQAVDSD